MIDKNDTDNIDVRFSKSLFLVLSNGNPRLSWKNQLPPFEKWINHPYNMLQSSKTEIIPVI